MKLGITDPFAHLCQVEEMFSILDIKLASVIHLLK